MKRNALGRGLEALISMDDIQTGGSSAISEIPIAQITPNPDQPHRTNHPQPRPARHHETMTNRFVFVLS